MNIDAYVAAKADAIAEIGIKLNIDLSSEALPKANEPKVLELFRLQKIAALSPMPVDEVEVPAGQLDDILDRIKNTKGVGSALYERIEKSLRK